MAEFSKENNLKIGFLDNDFSYLEIFKRMELGEIHSQICEGFGSVAIEKGYDGTPYLIFKEKG